MRGALKYTLLQGVGVLYDPPAGLSWPSQYPSRFLRSGSTFYALNSDGSRLDPKTMVNAAIWSGTAYYVDPAKADNAGDGLSWANAKRDINAAITAGNATAAPYRVYCRYSDSYHQTRSINGSGGTVEPTQHCALIASDPSLSSGRCRHYAGTIETFSATPDVTYTNTYTGGPSSAVRVFDRINLDSHGNYTELTNVVDQATCDTTPGSWVDIGASLAVRRTDGLQPTLANTLVTRNINVASMQTCTVDMYVEGFDFEGGPSGAFWADAIATRNLVFINCTFKYAAQTSTPLSSLRVRRNTGLVYFDGCEASQGWADGFNFHRDNGTSLMYVLCLNCWGWNNGKVGSTSNNCFTTHDDIISAFLSTRQMGESLLGADMHCIETTKSWFVGARVKTTANGDTHPASFKASNNAIMWLDSVTADSVDYALHAQGVAGVIHKRNVAILAGTEQVDSGATIDTY